VIVTYRCWECRCPCVLCMNDEEIKAEELICVCTKLNPQRVAKWEVI